MNHQPDLDPQKHLWWQQMKVLQIDRSLSDFTISQRKQRAFTQVEYSKSRISDDHLRDEIRFVNHYL